MGSGSSRLSNRAGLSLSLAVWLAADDYDTGETFDYPPGKDIVSVTTLMKPTRQFILAQRVPELLPGNTDTDLLDLIPSRLGHAIHSSMEEAWYKNHAKAMRRLGYPEKVIQSIRVNPFQVEPDTIPVYLEQRFWREIDGVVITGKFDQIINGSLNDTKTTSVWTWVHNTKEEDYRIQLSIYRWINPEKVTSDVAYIQHVFTDWQKSMARQYPDDYPQSRVKEFKITLMSLHETEVWIKNKLQQIRLNIDKNQKDMVRCSEKDLWRGPTQYKYYSKAENATKVNSRSSKNFDDKQLAYSHMATVGKGKGIVKTVPGRVRACSYCPAFDICTQKDEYEHD